MLNHNKKLKICLIRADIKTDSRPLHPRHIHPPLDLFYIMTELQDMGHECFFYDMCLEEKPDSSKGVCRYDIAIIKGASFCLDESLSMAKELKDQGVQTIAIGQQVSHQKKSPVKEWKKSFSTEIHGEPEQIIPLLISKQQQDKPLSRSNLWHAAHFVNTDEIKPLRWPIERLKDYPFPFPFGKNPSPKWGYIITAWGCPHKCLFCTEIVRKSTGDDHRKKPLSLVLDELEDLVRLGANAIYFDDDTLLVNKYHFRQIIEGCLSRDLKFNWVIHARPDEIDDGSLKLLNQLGDGLVKIGIETLSPKIIETLGKTKKGELWPEHCDRSLEICRANAVDTVALVMLGTPHESQLDRQTLLSFLKKKKPTYIQAQIYTEYPDTKLKTLSSSDSIQEDYYHYKKADNTQNERIKSLSKVQTSFYSSYYLRPGYIFGHITKFWRFYVTSFTGLRPFFFLMKIWPSRYNT